MKNKHKFPHFGVALALIIALCIAVPSISAYLTTSESKDSSFTIAKQESGPPVDEETYDYGDYTYTYSESDGGWAVELNWDVTDEYQTFYGAILEKIKGKPVVSVDGTFQECRYLTIAPVIPSSVTTMGATFEGCASLKTYAGSTDPDGDFSSYRIPDGVTNMDETFFECELLTTVPEIPNSVVSMRETFESCTSLTTAPVIPSSVTDMTETFDRCTSLKTYTGSTDPDGDFSNYKIPDGVTDMYATFSECKLLTVAPIIPNSAKDSISNLFNACSSLRTYAGSTDPDGDFSNYKLPDGVTDMYATFRGCELLTVAPAIPDSVEELDTTFEGCTSLTTAPVIPDSVTDMRSTFEGCISLKTYTGSTDPDGDFSNYKIPCCVTRMWTTFSGCASLTTAPEIPNSVAEIERDMTYMFNDCTSLVIAPIIPANATNIQGVFCGCASLKTYAGSTDPDGDFSNYKIPNGVTSMSNTFSGCTSLTTAPVIPSSVTNMNRTFYDCIALTGEIEINANIDLDYWNPKWNYNGCFENTILPITLKGTSTMLNELAATANNGNVTVQQ